MTKEQSKLLKLLPGYEVKMTMGVIKLCKEGEVLAEGCANVSKKMRELANCHTFVSKHNHYYRHQYK